MDEEHKEFLQKLFSPLPDPDIDFVPGMNGCIHCRHPYKIDSDVSRCPMCELTCHWPWCIKAHVTAFCERVRN